MDKTFKACMTLIERGKMGEQKDFLAKLDILMLNNRLTQEEYAELAEAVRQGQV